MATMKVGEYFLDKGLISESDISLALSFQKNHPTYLGEILFKLGKISETELLQYLSKQFNVQYITSEKLEKMAVVNPADIIPVKMAMDRTIFPLKYSINNYRLTLLTYEPQNIVLFDELKILLNGVHTVIPVVAPSNVIKALILKQYSNDVNAFDRLVRNTVQVNQNMGMFSNETIINLENPNDIEMANRIQDISTMDDDKLRQENRETFSMIVNKAELSDQKLDVTAVTTSMMSNMPSWVREQGNQLIELLRVFSNLLDVARGDEYFAHSQRVAILCKEIGEAIHLSEVELYDLTIAAYLHDVGKKVHLTALDIKNQTSLEKMKNYSLVVTKLFTDVQLSKLALNCLENMYETYNGQGFPRGLKLNEIPIGSLILLLANTYDFMTRISNIPPKEALRQLKETMFFSDRIIEALEQTQQISEANSSLKKITAIVISQKKF
ncbi:HD domain-containing protein, partial [bacterium]|nr:HD domain-containing protein [bacterium]